jgi:hypothetical protein
MIDARNLSRLSDAMQCRASAEMFRQSATAWLVRTLGI